MQQASHGPTPQEPRSASHLLPPVRSFTREVFYVSIQVIEKKELNTSRVIFEGPLKRLRDHKIQDEKLSGILLCDIFRMILSILVSMKE